MGRVIDIASLRKAKKIKQSEMAELLGINQSQISEMERGLRPVSPKYEETLILQYGEELCDEFKVEADKDRRIPQAGTVINDSSPRFGRDNAKEIKKAGQDFYEVHPYKEDKIVIEALAKEIEHLTEMLAEKDKRIDSLEQSLLRKDAQLDNLITLLKQK